MIGELMIGIGFFLILTGFVGLMRFRKFYQRLLICGLADTFGVLVILFGVMLRQGISMFTLKTVLILVAVFLVGPLLTHKLGRSAYLSGHRE